MLVKETDLTDNFKQYARYLQLREKYTLDGARAFAYKMQEFYASGKTAKEYAAELYVKNQHWASSFLFNYSFYGQYLTTTYFSELMEMRREIRANKKARNSA